MTFFSIQPDRTSVDLAADRTGAVNFTVQNKSGVARAVRGVAVTDDEAEQAWFTVEPGSQPARVDETVQFVTRVTVPADAAAGPRSFRLRVVAEDDPDDVHSESAALSYTVPEGKKPTPFPWWIAAVVAAVVLVVAVAGFLVFGGGGGGPEVVGINVVPQPQDGALPTVQFRADGTAIAPVQLEVELADGEVALADLTVSWRSDAQGSLGAGPVRSTNLVGVCAGGINHEIEVTATDQEGNDATFTRDLRVFAHAASETQPCPLIGVIGTKYQELFEQGIVGTAANTAIIQEFGQASLPENVGMVQQATQFAVQGDVDAVIDVQERSDE